MIITKLIFKNKNIKYGDLSGKCVLCGDNTSNGFELDFSDTFVGYSFFSSGSVLCPFCYAFFKNEDFRKKNFLYTNGEIVFYKKNELMNFLKNPPEPPFYIYLTKSKLKKGWLGKLHYISYSKSRFYLIYDQFEFPVVVDRGELDFKMNLLEFLLSKNIKKQELETGEFSYDTYKMAIKENFINKLNMAKVLLRDPLWEILIYIS